MRPSTTDTIGSAAPDSTTSRPTASRNSMAARNESARGSPADPGKNPVTVSCMASTCSTTAQPTALFTWSRMSISDDRGCQVWVTAAGSAGSTGSITCRAVTSRPAAAAAKSVRNRGGRSFGRPEVGSRCTHSATASIRAPRSPVTTMRRSAHRLPIPEQNVANSSDSPDSAARC